MRYTNSELRSNKIPLLRRLQRQMNEQKIMKEEAKERIVRGFSLKSKEKLDFDKPKQNKRLNLLDKRNMFR